MTGKHHTLSGPSVSNLEKAYRLTPAEAVVVLALAGGMVPSEIARQRGTSVHTVRTHIKRSL